MKRLLWSFAATAIPATMALGVETHPWVQSMFAAVGGAFAFTIIYFANIWKEKE